MNRGTRSGGHGPRSRQRRRAAHAHGHVPNAAPKRYAGLDKKGAAGPNKKTHSRKRGKLRARTAEGWV